MIWTIGQIVQSNAEPELGLGHVSSLEHKHITISFESDRRMYSLQEVPIRRKRFRCGDLVIDINGRNHELCESNQSDNDLIVYSTTAGATLSEIQIMSMVGSDSPVDILQNRCSLPNEFDSRTLAISLRTEFENSPIRGFIGGKIDLMTHQFSVASSIVNARTRRFFLADEVGLGKTIESALVIHKLLITGEISRVLIVTPPALQYQWFVELYRKFNLTIRIADADLVESFRGVESMSEIPLLLVSTDLLEHSTPFSESVVTSSWDLLVIDEAHHCEETSLSFSRINILSENTPNLLLLSATPDVLSPKNFFTLMALLDPKKFPNFDKFVEEQELYQCVAEVANTILAGEELTSTHELFLNTRFPTQSQWLLSKMNTADRSQVVSLLSDVGGIGRSLFRHSRSSVLSSGERHVELVPLENDVNSDSIGEWLDQFLKENRIAKVVVICTNNSIHNYSTHLSRVQNRKIALFNESMSIIQLDRNAAWFADPEGANCLLSTEIGCEGRNFQFADHLILTNLPTDPELLEQRIGRVDRIGRIRPVSIVIPYIKGSSDERLARWYHEGMNAFRTPIPGGFQVTRQYLELVLATIPDSDNWQKLCEDTKSMCTELSFSVEKGRHRLLELSRDDQGHGASLIQTIQAYEKGDFGFRAQKLLIHFGIEINELTVNVMHLSFDHLTDQLFPVPHGYEEDGMSITFDRETALSRADVTFLTPDHPMISGAIDLILSSEEGRLSVGRLIGQGEEGILCEQRWILASSQKMSVASQKFFASTITKLLLDEFCEDVENLFAESIGTQKVIAHGEPEEILHEWGETILAQIKTGENLMEAQRENVIRSAVKKVRSFYHKERSRIILIGGDFQEIDIRTLASEEAQMVTLINDSMIKLDSIRVILLEP